MLDWKLLCIKCCFMCITFIAASGVAYFIFETIRNKWEERKNKHEKDEE